MPPRPPAPRPLPPPPPRHAPPTGTPGPCRPPILLRSGPPDTRVLAAVHRPPKAGIDHRAAQADTFRFFDLEQRGPRVSDGKEQFRVYLTAGGVMAPVHAANSSMT